MNFCTITPSNLRLDNFNFKTRFRSPNHRVYTRTRQFSQCYVELVAVRVLSYIVSQLSHDTVTVKHGAFLSHSHMIVQQEV